MLGVLKSLRVHALTWVIVSAVAACGESEIEKATRLVLVTDTDIEALVSVTYIVEPPRGEPKQARGSVEPGRPAFVVMEKSDSASSGPYKVHVAGLDGDDTVLVERDAEVSFVTGKTLAVPLHLVEACRHTMCPETESCSPEGCVPRKLASEDLPSWSGEPPTLRGGAADGGAELDGSSPDGDGSVPDGGGTCIPNEHCIGEALALCEDGNVVDTEPCPAAGLCTVGSCVEHMGCEIQPVDDGSTCADGAICSEGECVAGTLCTMNNCSPSCDVGEQCTVDCGTAMRCSPSCSTSSMCTAKCRDSDRCDATCGTSATCTIDCGASADCRPSCAADSTCDIWCSDGQPCDRAICASGADCVLHCGENAASCGFDDCQDGAMNCDGNVVVCGRDCP